MIFTLKPVPKHAFRLGLEQTPENYQIMPGCKYTWVPFMKGNRYLTGLDKDHDLRQKLEEELGVSLNDKSPCFYDNLKFDMIEKPNIGVILDDTKPLDIVILKAMKLSATIANGLSEYESGAKPYAEWYFENSDADVEASEKKRKFEMDAMDKYRNLTDSQKGDILTMLGYPTLQLSHRVIDKKLYDFLKVGVENCKLFLKIADGDPTLLNIQIMVKTAMLYNILRRTPSQDIYYGDELLGGTEELAVKRISESDQLRAGIESKIQLAKNADNH